MDTNLRKLFSHLTISNANQIANICSYETSDGVSRSEQGELKTIDAETQALSVRGTITWVAPDGETYTLNYIADENGYQPEGLHLPKL